MTKMTKLLNTNMKTFKHHITPQCMLRHKSKDFVDHPSNIIRVNYKQHVALHKWLYRLTGHDGCEVAFRAMSGGGAYRTAPHTKEAREKIRQANLGGTKSQAIRDKISASKIGVKKSAEHKKKIGDALRGRKRGPYKKKMLFFD